MMRKYFKRQCLQTFLLLLLLAVLQLGGQVQTAKIPEDAENGSGDAPDDDDTKTFVTNTGGGGTFQVDGDFDPVSGKAGGCGKGSAATCISGKKGRNYYGGKSHTSRPQSKHDDDVDYELDSDEQMTSGGSGRKQNGGERKKIVKQGEHGQSTNVDGDLYFENGYNVVAGNGADCPGPKCRSRADIYGTTTTVRTTTVSKGPVMEVHGNNQNNGGNASGTKNDKNSTSQSLSSVTPSPPSSRGHTLTQFSFFFLLTNLGVIVQYA